MRDVLASSISTVLRILDDMGIEGASEDAILAAPPFFDEPVLLPSRGDFNRFNGQLALKLRFVGYPFEEVALLSVRQLCEMYVRDSFPPVPEEPLSDERYHLSFRRRSPDTASAQKDFPICFVVGAPRSGTTLLRAMLNGHSALWAPGEMHLASFATMEERAHHVAPFLRYMPIPEMAARCRESVPAFSKHFRGWELSALPIGDVFEHLHAADPEVMIVDKSPPYSSQLHVLERIGATFPNARFIHLLRSPHDVIRSYVRMQFHRGDRALFEAGRNPYQAGEAIWTACNANVAAFFEEIPAERRCILRYEELVADPAASLQTVCDLLGRSFEPAMADPYGSGGAVALGAGDLGIHLLRSVENRAASEAFFPLGSRAQAMMERTGY